MQIPKPAWPMAIDVSEANNAGKPINWAEVVPKLRSRGIDRVIVRASYGGGYEDALFGHNWTALGMLDFPRAAYHAAVPSEVPHLIESSHQQAAFFWDIVQARGGMTNDDFAVLDLEITGAMTPTSLTKWGHQWFLGLEQAMAPRTYRTVFYSYLAFIEIYMTDYSLLRIRPLWLADYPGGTALPTKAPPNVGDWTQYYGWQYTDAGEVAGISGPVDLSVFDPAVAESPLKTAEAELARANKEIAALLKERKSLKAQVARLQKSGG
jgi:lysozyme